MADLGDITEFLKESSVSNLDWLDVDDKAYREVGALPKQNLDTIPDLEAQWGHAGTDPLLYFVPNRDMAGYPVDPRVPEAPLTMGDLSQHHGPLNAEIVRVARQTLMASDDLARFQQALSSRFDSKMLAGARTALASVLSERGLLGRYYIDAQDFPGCTTDKKAAEFVRRYASRAPLLKAKQACGDCACRTGQGGQHCSIFQKQIVQEVPLTDAVASYVETKLASQGMAARAPSGSSPAERIKTAYLSNEKQPKHASFSGQANHGALIPADRLFRKQSSEAPSLDSMKSRPVLAMIRRELLKGRSQKEVVRSMRLSFSQPDLKETQRHWLPLLKEAGLYGSLYSTQASFDDCRDGADFLSKHGSSIRAIVRGEKCASCVFSHAGRCSVYGRPLVAQAEDLYTPEVIASVLDQHRATGKISSVLVGQQWGQDPRQVLQNISLAAHEPAVQESTRLSTQSAFVGFTPTYRTSDVVRQKIVKIASRFMNEGLYGEDLQRSLQSAFDARDLVATDADLRSVLSEQGLQGIYYVDPTVYDDYGHGCKEAQRLHRSRQAVKYVLEGSKCGTCVHRDVLGTCSVLAKKLEAQIPYQDRTAQQQAILNSGPSTEIDYGSLVNNGLTMMQEYQLQANQVPVEVNPVVASDFSIEFGVNDVHLADL